MCLKHVEWTWFIPKFNIIIVTFTATSWPHAYYNTLIYFLKCQSQNIRFQNSFKAIGINWFLIDFLYDLRYRVGNFYTVIFNTLTARVSYQQSASSKHTKYHCIINFSKWRISAFGHSVIFPESRKILTRRIKTKADHYNFLKWYRSFETQDLKAVMTKLR